MFWPKRGQGELILTPGHKEFRVPREPLLGLQEAGIFLTPNWGEGSRRRQLGITGQNSQANIHAHRRPAGLSWLQLFLPRRILAQRPTPRNSFHVPQTKGKTHCEEPPAPRTKRVALNLVRTGPRRVFLPFSSPRQKQKQVCCRASNASWALSEFCLVFLCLSVCPPPPPHLPCLPTLNK